MIRYEYNFFGIVQGVGFRPFIYKIATQSNLTGFVFNHSNGVTAQIQGSIADIKKFDKLLYEDLPPLAKIDNYKKIKIDILNLDYSNDFQIKKTKNNKEKTILVSPDIKICDDCLYDIKNNEKYKNYFATNCTNCGPRYSIVNTVPYDRSNTSMNNFTMCVSCENDYNNPKNRRYHAQPISCNNCGPKLSLYDKEKKLTSDQTLIYKKSAKYIKDGKILAIKGIGGFHIFCDASNKVVAQRLREYKNRPTKPFAIMCKNINQIKKFANIRNKELEILNSKESPVVILKKKLVNNKLFTSLIAPNINKIGCMLPYTALHHLLFEHLKNPVIATSANLSGEPIVTKKEHIREKLDFVDYILDYNREIINAVDDSVVQIVNDEVEILRLARGYTPKVIKTNNEIKNKILAVGAHQKNSIALAFGDKIILSPYIGDLNTLASMDFFYKTIETFQRFYDFEADVILCDKHPAYETTKWAKKQHKPIYQIQHHLAHIYSVKAEHNLLNKYLGFSFDGTGYGEDKTLWGGEIFIGNKRKYYFKPIKLIGGLKAVKEPRRVALSLLFDKYSLNEVLDFDLDTVKQFDKNEIILLYNIWQNNINSPLSSSVGRLFDAVASLSNICHFQTYEGEAGFLCEMSYEKNCKDSFLFNINKDIINIEFDLFDKFIVTKFINTLVNIVIYLSKKENNEVIFSGGVFQNKVLLELICQQMDQNKIKYYYNIVTSINDGGIALGQINFYLKNSFENA